ncbi:energy-coupled thiamine transporter ThiT [Enterococcus sp. MJM12]|uniref:Energy-coupled thiamine transporter ThiT n=1 Tax=Candidatus Enterococcus myersii TaxID=2815322 RepID=A0ABS3H4I9_9ENTE|nr:MULTISPECIES: energy-coupled thiamine transporter ThiT [Enterococcus]MBO0448370.1 energy-coupled thiamine transporter ThiT [Enterococcus sp. MJM12]MDT2739770.1 energy-coupled thiamine transporter ThiT [Enterococcus canintestini]
MAKRLELQVWVEGTVIAAAAMALSFIPIQTANSAFDLSLGMVPLVLYSYRRGLIPGLTAGFVWGLLSIVIGTAMKNFVSVPQIIFEYPFAFAFGGFGGIFAKKIQTAVEHRRNTAVLYVVLGGVVAALARWFWHFWAGVFVWGAYAPEGMNPYLYSFILNGASALANAIYVAVVLGILVKVAPQLFIPKRSHFISAAKSK